MSADYDYRDAWNVHHTPALDRARSISYVEQSLREARLRDADLALKLFRELIDS